MVPDDPARRAFPDPRPDTSSNPQSPSAPADRQGGWSDLDTGTIIVAEFVSAILTWGGIGWLLDRWLRTEPWFIVLGFVIGTTAGFYLMYLRSHGMVVRETPPQDGSSPADGGNTDEGMT